MSRRSENGNSRRQRGSIGHHSLGFWILPPHEVFCGIPAHAFKHCRVLQQRIGQSNGRLPALRTSIPICHDRHDVEKRLASLCIVVPTFEIVDRRAICARRVRTTLPVRSIRPSTVVSSRCNLGGFASRIAPQKRTDDVDNVVLRYLVHMYYSVRTTRGSESIPDEVKRQGSKRTVGKVEK